MNIAYLPGIDPSLPEPLGRFLPPIPDGAAATWLSTRVAPGSWVLDPFGTSPRLVAEMARQGYRVLVAANNPIVRFLIEMAAAPPPRSELEISLAELAAASRGSERIEPHLRALYRTECAHCGATIMADAFLWEHAEGGKATAPAPYARIYACPNCRSSGEFPCTAGDISRATQFSQSTLHRARALERVAPHNDPDRPYAEQAINVYLPRAVYALFTLINKLDGLDLPLVRRQHLTALLLHACEQAHSLWKHPVERERRYQLNIPPRFHEHNVWLALEQGLDIWSAEGNPTRAEQVPLFTWPTLSETTAQSAGIWLFEGRLKSLAESLPGLDIKAVCTAIPRPNRAFWTLSALWAGWLWGYEAVGPFRSVLRRQRYDWGWHTTALVASLELLENILPLGTPVFGLMGEFEPNYLAAVLVAADLSGLHLESLAVRPEINNAQITWSRSSGVSSPSQASPEEVAKQAAIRYLEMRGEPASFAHSFSAAMAGLAQAHSSQNFVKKSAPFEEFASDAYTQSAAIGKEILAYRHGFLRYPLSFKGRFEASTPQAMHGITPLLGKDTPASEDATGDIQSGSPEKSSTELPESGLVWLRDASHATLSPLSGRIEVALVNYLLKHNPCRMVDLDAAMCAAFPDLLTPEFEYLQVCLDSYAEPDSNNPDSWHLRPQDTPAIRRQDLDEAEALINRLGERLGFTTQVRPSGTTPDGHPTQHTFCWVDRFELPQFWLYPIVSAVIGEIILQSTVPPGKSLIILPGGRANLVSYKLRRDPRLARLCDASQSGWRFIKFRHLRWLEGNPLLSRDNFDEQLILDPLTYSTPQLRLL